LILRVTTRTVPIGGTVSCIAYPDITYQFVPLGSGPSNGAIFIGGGREAA